ncbi:synergin gamma [Orussus abietinus]|uniref:synergin gamma n=1 Tax=Orussus abietinus TaxID=222816 RepID=UPI000625CC29|nr:synergin gamma [Orussus abietinus]
MSKIQGGTDKKMSQLPSWLWVNSNSLPPIYKHVWEAAREDKPSPGSIHGELLVDTNKVFPILLSSHLPAHVLGYIWSLANQKYAGKLTEQELYVVLALVAIAQASYSFNSLDILHFVPVPPTPFLNTALLDTRDKGDRNADPSFSFESNVNVNTFGGKHVLQGKAGSRSNPSDTIPFGPAHSSFNGKFPNDGKLDVKIQPTGGQPVSLNSVGFPDGRHNFQVHQDSRVTSNASTTDFGDDFSDFQSAPIPSTPTISILDTKQGSAIGSRLANHNLGVKRPSDKVKKSSANKNSHTNAQTRSSAANVYPAMHTKDGVMTERVLELFPKCTLKSQAKTVILKDTVIRNSEPPRTIESSSKNAAIVSEKASSISNSSTAVLGYGNKVVPKDAESVQQDLMNLQPVEDKYSALRILVEDASPSLVEPSTSPTRDDFGDFVSAEQPEPAQIAVNSSSSGSSLDLFTDFDFKQPIDDPNQKDTSLIQAISETFGALEIESSTDQQSLEDKFYTSNEPDKTFQKEDALSIHSIELGNGTTGGLTRSGSVPSLDLKSFLPSTQDEEQQVENMHQLIYWEWKQYMESCVLLLQVAANLFTNITSEVVLREVLSSAQGYNFLCNLAEVAAVCRRVNFSHKEMDINIMGFDDLLLDIDRIWAEMEPFYANIPIVTELPVWPEHQGEGMICALCLTVVTSGRVVYNENNYHATCANLWLNCVSSDLPALAYSTFQMHSSVPSSSSHI